LEDARTFIDARRRVRAVAEHARMPVSTKGHAAFPAPSAPGPRLRLDATESDFGSFVSDAATVDREVGLISAHATILP